MISPHYAQATGIKTFINKLEQPIGLQLACMGSKSTINYVWCQKPHSIQQ